MNTNSPIMRFISLVLGALLGILLAYVFYKYGVGLLDISGNQGLKNTITLIFLGLPISVLLWYFRTHDVRENIHQNDLFNALSR